MAEDVYGKTVKFENSTSWWWQNIFFKKSFFTISGNTFYRDHRIATQNCWHTLKTHDRWCVLNMIDANRLYGVAMATMQSQIFATKKQTVTTLRILVRSEPNLLGLMIVQPWRCLYKNISILKTLPPGDSRQYDSLYFNYLLLELLCDHLQTWWDQCGRVEHQKLSKAF